MKKQAHTPITHLSNGARRWQPVGSSSVRRLLLLLLLGLWLTAPSAHAQSTNTHRNFVIAVATDVPPFAAQAENGQLVGFDVDLLKMVVRTAGLRVTYEGVPFAELVPGVATHLYDAGVGCLKITEERRALVDFTAPYFISGNVFAFAENSTPIYDLTDLTPEMNVSVLAGSAGWSYLTAQKVSNVQALSSIEEALALAAARATAASFVDEVFTERYMRDNPEARLQVVSGLVTKSQCGIAVSKGNSRLLLELDAAMTRLKNNGKYLATYHRWFGNRPLTGWPPVSRPTSVPAEAAMETAVATTTTAAQGEASTLAAVNTTVITPTTAVQGDASVTAAIGVYTVNLLTAPNAYQVIELAANGVWLESLVTEDEAALRGVAALTTGQLPVQGGRWQITNADPLAQTVAISATVHFSATAPIGETAEKSTQVTIVPPVQPYKEYQLTIKTDGTIRGGYTLYTSGAPTTTALLTSTIELVGQRVVQ